MKINITKILFLLLIIVLQTTVFAQRKSKKNTVCNQTCPSGYICAFGDIDQLSDSKSDKNSAKDRAKTVARAGFAETMVTFVESNTELNIIGENGNDQEFFNMASKFETRFKEENVNIDGPFECPDGDGRWIARASKKEADVFNEIKAHNDEKHNKANDHLKESKNSTSYEEKIRNIFQAFVYNKAQLKSVYRGERIYKDIYPEINAEIIKISKSLVIDVPNPPSKLSFDGKLGGNIKIIVRPTGFMDIEKQPTMRLMADLVKGLVNTSDGYWNKNRTASIPVEFGEGFIRIDKVLSPQHVEILIKLDLDQYNPSDYLFDELGYPRNNRINPSEVFAKLFEKIQKEVKISISSNSSDRKTKRGKIYISTPDYEKPLEVKINGVYKDKTTNAKYESDYLGFSYYTVELYPPQSSVEKIIPVKEVIRLITTEERLEIRGIKKMTSSIEFISSDDDVEINVHIKGTSNKVDTEIYVLGQIDETRLEREHLDFDPQYPNTIQLNSGIYNIFLSKEGEQTTKLYNNNLGWVDARRQINLHIEKPPFNRKMLEYVPFVKPYICNEKNKSKLIKTSLLALVAFVTSKQHSDYIEKKGIYFSHKEEYEALGDVQQNVFDDKRVEMKSAHEEFSSAFSTLNYLYAGLGITYGYTIFF